MRRLSAGWRRAVNIVLPIVILGDMIFYQFCLSSCSYLQGDILGIDMKYVGLFIPLPLIAMALLKQDLFYLLALSFGLGGEIKLISFQIQQGIYCPYCLLAGAIIVLLFLANLDRSRKTITVSSVIIGFLFFQLFFHGAAAPSYGEENGTTSWPRAVSMKYQS
jgi:hypothetical protein